MRSEGKKKAWRETWRRREYRLGRVKEKKP